MREVTMLVIELMNISKLAPVSDYKYKVWVTTVGGHEKVISEGTIKGHTREDGWAALVQRLLNERNTDIG